MTTKEKIAPKPRKPRKYINNHDLLIEVALSKEQGQMTEKLAKMLTMLCTRYGTRGNYVGYSYNDDMQAYAMMMVCRTWHKFNPEKSNNPFAFYTQCIKHSFIQFLNQEKRQRDIRDEMLINNGMNPSLTYQMANETFTDGGGDVIITEPTNQDAMDNQIGDGGSDLL